MGRACDDGEADAVGLGDGKVTKAEDGLGDGTDEGLAETFD
jgi:hypothetical protein